jgi:hypothetical protein
LHKFVKKFAETSEPRVPEKMSVVIVRQRVVS